MTKEDASSWGREVYFGERNAGVERFRIRVNLILTLTLTQTLTLIKCKMKFVSTYVDWWCCAIQFRRSVPETTIIDPVCAHGGQVQKNFNCSERAILLRLFSLSNLPNPNPYFALGCRLERLLHAYSASECLLHEHFKHLESAVASPDLPSPRGYDDFVNLLTFHVGAATHIQYLDRTYC